MNLTRAEFEALLEGNPKLADALAKQGGEKVLAAKPKRRSKYNAEPVYVTLSSGRRVKVASKKEGRRLLAIDCLMVRGDVLWFNRQGKFDLPGGTEYRIDFTVQWADGHVTNEDVKGIKTKEYKLKKRAVEAIYRVTITEV